MKKTRAIQRALSAGAAVCLAAVALSGCELLVDFDRSKIPVEAGSGGNDATLGDSAPPTEAGDDGTLSGDVGTEAAGDDASDTDANAGSATDDASGDAADAATADGTPPDNGLDTGLADAAQDGLDDAADAPSADGDDGG